MRKLWAALKFLGRWLGPAIVVLAAVIFVLQPFPFNDFAATIAIQGAVLSAIAWFFARKSGSQRDRKILGTIAIFAFVFCGWRTWEGGRGFHTETVSFDNHGARLVGTLYLPDRPGKVPGMVWLHGSGRFPRSAFDGYATYFAKAGYAILVYDKRGIGDSLGPPPAECYTCVDKDLEMLASDGAAGLALLAARPEVRADAVGFTGTSEGGMIAPRAAVISGKAIFLLNLTSYVASIRDLEREMQTKDLRERGLPVGRADALAEAAIESWKLTEASATFDPLTSLRVLDIPAMWVLAEEDVGLTTENIDALRKAGKPFQYRVIPGASHSLWIGPKDQVLETIDTWLAKVTAEKPRVAENTRAAH